MSYVLTASESTAAGIKRVIEDELESAAGQLNQKSLAKRDEAIHEARKSVKKIRAALRLVEGNLGESFPRENRRLRDTGRQLANFRDAAAAIEIFDKVMASQAEETGLSSIRRVLQRYKRETAQGAGVRAVLDKLVVVLSSTNERVKEWPLDADGFPVIGKGLQRTFRRGRKAMAAAQKDESPVNYHDWRKRVKDHWYQLMLLEHLWTAPLRAQMKTLKELETCLGDDHDLVLLLEKLEAKHTDFKPKDLESFQAAASHHQKRLRERAVYLGRKIYDEKPADFILRVDKRWDVWLKGLSASSKQRRTRSSKAQ
jgi:CHAD domain-containing protein